MSNGETIRKIDRFCVVNRYAAGNGDEKAGQQEGPDCLDLVLAVQMEAIFEMF